MRVHIEVLRRPDACREVLQQDGWRLQGGEDSFSATHPGAPDEDSARQRLLRLGLLTSAWLRIDFDRLARPERPEP
jgi:hypothetical protein